MTGMDLFLPFLAKALTFISGSDYNSYTEIWFWRLLHMAQEQALKKEKKQKVVTVSAGMTLSKATA